MKNRVDGWMMMDLISCVSEGCICCYYLEASVRIDGWMDGFALPIGPQRRQKRGRGGKKRMIES